MKKKITTTIAGATALLSVFGLIGKTFGLVRESLFANYFGLSADYDLYLIAVVLPIGINSVVLYITQNYFIPNYHLIKVESDSEAERFSNTTFWLFTFSGIFIAIILFFFSEPLLRMYLQDDNPSILNSTIVIFRIFIFTIPLNAIYSVLASLLQCKSLFKYPVISQLMVNITVIIFVISFNNQLNIISIPVGYLTGILLQVLYLLLKSREFLLPNIKSFLTSGKFAFIGFSFLFLVLIEILGQTYSIIDRYFFEQLDQGSIAALNYAFILFNLPITIIAFALTTVLFPAFSKLSGEKSYDEISIHLKKFFSINLFVFIPITIVLVQYGDFIISLIFERGAFGKRATLLTHNAIIVYAFSYVFLSSYFVLNKLFYSFNKIRILFFITLIGISLKVFLSLSLVPDYKQDGLAFTTSFTYFFLFIVSYIVIFKHLQFKNFSTFLVELLFSGFNGLFSYFVVSLVRLPSVIQEKFLTDILELTLFVIVYIVNGYFTKHSSILLLSELFNGILGNRIKTKN